MARMIRRVAKTARAARAARFAAMAVELVAAAFAGGSVARAETDALDGVQVERIDDSRSETSTLRFLDENREFFRARLDLLRVTLGPRHGSAREIDPRFLRWREMLADIESARDSTAAGEEWIRRRELMQSVEDLLALEQTLDGMESMLAEQAERLVRLEEDFVGTQSTALVVLLTGVAPGRTPREVSLVDPDGEDWRVELSDEARLALERGGTIELLHRLVEPRVHRLTVRVAGDGWEDSTPRALSLDPARDRMTFVELDLAELDAAERDVFHLRTWVR